MPKRKELKKRARRTLKTHYFLLVFLCLVSMFWGTELKSGSSALGAGDASGGKSSILTGNSAKQTVLGDILAGNIAAGEQTSEQAMEEDASRQPVNIGGLEVGYNKGVLANAVNQLSSGQLTVWFANALVSIVKSQKIATALFVLLGFFVYSFIWIFFLNLYTAAMRRLFLEARSYEKVSFTHLTHFFAVRRWRRAALTMLVKSVFLDFWTLTIIGGIIKRYSYYLVPYIVAENPDIKPLEAITLSRRMMDGHKREFFVAELSFAGWVILSAFTGGLLNIFFTTPYIVCVFSEYYAELRKMAKDNNMPGADRLDDEVLFTPAPEERLAAAYSDIVEMEKTIQENEVPISKWQKFLVEWFGVWIGKTKTKRAYQKNENRKFQNRRDIQAQSGEAYPSRLNPLYRASEIHLTGRISFIRCYTVWSLILMFLNFSLIGWIWEVSLHLIQFGEFVNRGTLLGPWLPIYGMGGMVALILTNKLKKNPALTFLWSIVICGVIEYSSATSLWNRFHQKWWDYSGYFLNVNGRICAEGLLVFGIGCVMVIYLIAPIMDMIFSRIKTQIVIPICIFLGGIFMTDYIHSQFHPNSGEGVTEAVVTEYKTPAGELRG